VASRKKKKGDAHAAKRERAREYCFLLSGGKAALEGDADPSRDGGIDTTVLLYSEEGEIREEKKETSTFI